jgi:hypothetical protein
MNGLYDILECDVRPTALGPALRVRIHRHDGAAMPWRELWEVFAKAYPGRWGVQSFPPDRVMIDQVNKYHLLIFDEAPAGFDIAEPPPAGTRAP